MFTEQDAWQLVEDLKTALRRSPVRKTLRSVYHCGGLTRGEFDALHSEVDPLFIVGTPDGRFPTDIRAGLQFIKQIDQKWRVRSNRSFPCVDIGPWLPYDTLPLEDSPHPPESLVLWPAYKYFTVYAFDFVKHAQVLWGEDIRDRLVVRPPSELTYLRLMSIRDRLRVRLQGLDEESATHEARTGFAVKTATFEAARALYLDFGTRTLSKKALIENFDRVVPEFPSRGFFRMSLLVEYRDPAYLAYLEPRECVRFFEGCLCFVEDATMVAGQRRLLAHADD